MKTSDLSTDDLEIRLLALPSHVRVDKLHKLTRQRWKCLLPMRLAPAIPVYTKANIIPMAPVRNLEARLRELGYTLPEVTVSKGNYVPFRIEGKLLFVSGQLCVGPDGKLSENYRGKLGSKITEADGYAAARLCLLQVLAQARMALGSLDRLRSCIRLGGFVNAEPDFTTPGAAMNGASDMIVEIMGEAGRHSRTTIGVATLPLGSCIEVEALFSID